jgi:hypothetical protein
MFVSLCFHGRTKDARLKKVKIGCQLLKLIKPAILKTIDSKYYNPCHDKDKRITPQKLMISLLNWVKWLKGSEILLKAWITCV